MFHAWRKLFDSISHTSSSFIDLHPLLSSFPFNFFHFSLRITYKSLFHPIFFSFHFYIFFSVPITNISSSFPIFFSFRFYPFSLPSHQSSTAQSSSLPFLCLTLHPSNVTLLPLLPPFSFLEHPSPYTSVPFRPSLLRLVPSSFLLLCLCYAQHFCSVSFCRGRFVTSCVRLLIFQRTIPDAISSFLSVLYFLLLCLFDLWAAMFFFYSVQVTCSTLFRISFCALHFYLFCVWYVVIDFLILRRDRSALALCLLIHEAFAACLLM